MNLRPAAEELLEAGSQRDGHLEDPTQDSGTFVQGLVFQSLGKCEDIG
jgi:hypothetical protein